MITNASKAAIKYKIHMNPSRALSITQTKQNIPNIVCKFYTACFILPHVIYPCFHVMPLSCEFRICDGMYSLQIDILRNVPKWTTHNFPFKKTRKCQHLLNLSQKELWLCFMMPVKSFCWGMYTMNQIDSMVDIKRRNTKRLTAIIS